MFTFFIFPTRPVSPLKTPEKGPRKINLRFVDVRITRFSSTQNPR